MSKKSEIDHLPLKDGFYPIHEASRSGAGSLKELRRLIGVGVDLNVRTPWGRTPLITACIEGEIKKVEELIKAGADLNIQDKNLDTALHTAITVSNRITSMLIEAGADLEIKNSEGMTPLRRACYVGKQGAIDALCAAGANVKTDENNVESLIFFVLDRKQGTATTLEKIITTLIKNGASLNFKHPYSGNTELHLAAQLTQFDYSAWGHRFVGTIKKFINGGVNPWEKNDKGESAIDIMNPMARKELDKTFRKFIKGKEKNIAMAITSKAELKCFFYNQKVFTANDLRALLKEGTEAKINFYDAIGATIDSK